MGAGLQSVENTQLLSALCPVNEYSLLHHREIKAIKLRMFCGFVSVMLYTISLLSSAVPDKLDIYVFCFPAVIKILQHYFFFWLETFIELHVPPWSVITNLSDIRASRWSIFVYIKPHHIAIYSSTILVVAWNRFSSFEYIGYLAVTSSIRASNLAHLLRVHTTFHSFKCTH